MEKTCDAYYDGMLAGFMCRRKPHTTGRHMWFIKGKPKETGWYWTNETNSYILKYARKAR